MGEEASGSRPHISRGQEEEDRWVFRPPETQVNLALLQAIGDDESDGEPGPIQDLPGLLDAAGGDHMQAVFFQNPPRPLR